jgi:23S rRNA (cytidine2498-2'-O)-methyltransferase
VPIGNKTVGVQARSVADVSAKPRGALLDAVHKAVDDSGAVRANGIPDFALSVILTFDEIMLGLSPASLNLSSFAGGNRSYKRTDELISRSEFKLLEAFEVFDIHLSGGKALDLGGAPGGWSRILSGSGFTVVTVDPAELDERLKDVINITHVKATAQQYLSKISNSDIAFDFLANDMKMESSLSARLVSQFLPYLKPDAYVILTLKLLPGKYLKQIYNAQRILESRFEIIGIRQLFHNRNEVTVCLKLKQ